MPKKTTRSSYRKIRGSELPKKKQRELQAAMQKQVVEQLIDSIRQHPPEVDLSDVILILQPGKDISDFDLRGLTGICGHLRVDARIKNGVNPAERRAVAHAIVGELELDELPGE